MTDDKAKGNDREWPLIFGKWAAPADIVRTFWGSSRAKHDPQDRSSKDWANSEPDPNAP